MPSARAYVRLTLNGVPLQRPDFANVRFLLNDAAVSGLQNSQGQPFITSGSDPAGAIRAALAAWNGVPTSVARFAPLGGTAAVNDSNDRLNVIVFRDTPEIRSFMGTDVADHVSFVTPDGKVLETDILFNPMYKFSTTREAGTYDIQSVAAHELGHALGANHTGVVGATMYQDAFPGQIGQRRLSPDDIAFASAVYPPPGGNGYGTISGKLSSAGNPLRGGFVTADDPSTGVVIDGLSSLTDATYSFQVPPGNYEVYAEPLTGDVKPANLYLNANQVDSGFKPSFYGGNDTPARLSVAPGAVATADLAAPAGQSSVQLQFLAVKPVGEGGTVLLVPGPQTVASGQSVDVLLFGPGIDGGLNDANLRAIGPATLHPGSVHLDAATVNGSPVVRFTLDVPARSERAAATLVIAKGSDLSLFSGGLLLAPPPPVFTAASTVNAASFIGGGVAPGEIVTIFGTNAGPATPVQNAGFDAGGSLPTTLGDVSVTFGGVLAPLFYVSPGQINLQVPYEVAGSPAVNVSIQVGGSESAQISIPIVAASPGVFQIPGKGQGIVVNQDGTVNSSANPAARGSVVTVYATGAGVTNPPLATGKGAPGSPLSRASDVAATIGGVAANVLFGGATPGFVGLFQVNAEIPSAAPSGGTVPLRITVGGTGSQPNATISVQ
ncbi:MAG: matrixin family metalloprotease [Acidobacteriota bacterium]|nr:matrixin family metalloprotease [Acidobacteriota bacterium]